MSLAETSGVVDGGTDSSSSGSRLDEDGNGEKNENGVAVVACIEHLPPEVLSMVFEQIDASPLGCLTTWPTVGLVCRRWRSVAAAIHDATPVDPHALGRCLQYLVQVARIDPRHDRRRFVTQGDVVAAAKAHARGTDVALVDRIVPYDYYTCLSELGLADGAAGDDAQRTEACPRCGVIATKCRCVKATYRLDSHHQPRDGDFVEAINRTFDRLRRLRAEAEAAGIQDDNDLDTEWYDGYSSDGWQDSDGDSDDRPCDRQWQTRNNYDDTYHSRYPLQGVPEPCAPAKGYSFGVVDVRKQARLSVRRKPRLDHWEAARPRAPDDARRPIVYVARCVQYLLDTRACGPRDIAIMSCAAVVRRAHNMHNHHMCRYGGRYVKEGYSNDWVFACPRDPDGCTWTCFSKRCWQCGSRFFYDSRNVEMQAAFDLDASEPAGGPVVY